MKIQIKETKHSGEEDRAESKRGSHGCPGYESLTQHLSPSINGSPRLEQNPQLDRAITQEGIEHIPNEIKASNLHITQSKLPKPRPSETEQFE